MSDCESISMRTPLRKIVWSSANKTRIFLDCIRLNLLERNFDVNVEPSVLSIFDNQLTAELACSRPHPDHPQTGCLLARLRFDPAPVSAISSCTVPPATRSDTTASVASAWRAIFVRLPGQYGTGAFPPSRRDER